MTVSHTKTSAELEKLAARIADDEPVDWRATVATLTAGNNPALQGLREVEQVVNGFRHVQLASGRDTPRTCRFRFGHLTVLDPLGAGSQGDVWRAYDSLLDLEVALKLRKLDSGVLSHQFLEEARRLARVRQANIVSVYGAAVHDGRAGIWTELIRGTSLSDLLTQHGPFPHEEVCSIGLDLCHALAAVHRHGLLHGDLKLGNVMREVSGRIVLMDFGAAREQDAAQASVISGSLQYLAPEILRGGAPSVAGDIYALGVALFRLLTGVYPYTATTLPELLTAQDNCECLTLQALRPGLPKSLVRAVESALSSDPARRCGDALAFASALSQPAAKTLAGWRGVGLVTLLAAFIAAGVSVIYGGWRAGTDWRSELTFYRVDGRTSTALTDGASIKVGDRLSLAFRTSAPAYVYVFDDDGSGEAAVLFPLPGIEPANPLAADTSYQLPGKSATQPITWQVSSNAEREQFIVVVADAAQPQLERAIAAWRHASQTTATRGTLGLAPAPTETEISSASLRAELQRLAGDPSHVRRWQFVFPHSDAGAGVRIQ